MLCAEYCVEYCYCGSRNPLHGICGALEIIRAPDATPAVTSELLTAMQEGVDLMCTITNDLLDLEKLKCGKFVVKPTAVALRVLVETVASAARPACSGALTVAIDPRVPQTLLVDGQRLRQVLTNGLSNACKHAENVTLSVCVVASESAPPGAPRVLLRVLDDGTGLLGVDVTKLFDDFSAAASAVSMHGSVNGSGLGLPICGRLSQLMGGSRRSGARLAKAQATQALRRCRTRPQVQTLRSGARSSPGAREPTPAGHASSLSTTHR
jgi:signal transduction histidine kinase